MNRSSRFLLWVAILMLAAVAAPAVAQEGAKAPDGKAREAAKAPLLTPEEIAKHLKEKNVYLLDVRTIEELRETGSWPGYHHIPIGELEKRLAEVPKDKLVLTACKRGARASRAADVLLANGYKVIGTCAMDEWQKKGYETVKVDK